jgi:hypothetical protein
VTNWPARSGWERAVNRRFVFGGASAARRQAVRARIDTSDVSLRMIRLLL